MRSLALVQNISKRSSFWVLGIVLIALPRPVLSWQEPATQPSQGSEVTWPGVDFRGDVLLPNGWSLRPAGQQSRLNNDFPARIARHPNEPILAILFAGLREHEVITLNVESSEVITRAPLPATFAGLVWSSDGSQLFVGGGFNDLIHRFDVDQGELSGQTEFAYPDRERFLEASNPGFGGGTRDGQRVPGGLALSRDDQTLWVAHTWGHSIGRFNAATGEYLGEIAIGDSTYPYELLLDESRNRLYVSLWGNSSVLIVDTESSEIEGRWETQEHPNEMILARDGALLYVANANRNTVSVIETESGRALETIGTAIAPDAPSGSTPNSIVLTPDEKILLVANANTNDLAVVNVEDPGKSKPLGFIPVGWYPTSVRLSEDGKTIYVTNGKGAMSKSNRNGPHPSMRERPPTIEYIGSLFEGTLSVIEMPDPAQMAVYTKTVYECCPLDRENPEAVTQARPAGNPIPAKVGDSSPIKYCIYIIKENRTYDQVFGDIPEGNGEPALCLFPERVTPNHHALAQEYVLLDNFYVESEVSADGHEWTMAAYATDFVERTWPLGYRGDRRVPYPAEGAFDIATPAGGYLWDRAKEAGVSYRSYGEFVRNGPTPDDPATTNVEALVGHIDPFYRSYDLSYPDYKRAERFLSELARFEDEGEMPQLQIVRIGNDHTSGTRPGAPTPTAQVADNDLALGMIVEGLSKSSFWPQTAIFVVEDDAQNGPDHVDAHRTIALAVSPYTKGRGLDSTMYSTSSMLRTMELILGLEPMSQFDAAARPMYNSFLAEADASPYELRPAQVDIEAVNPETAWGAQMSLEMNLAVEDAADDLLFNEIIWRSVKGADSPMPAPVRSAFVLQVDDEDEDDEDEDDGDGDEQVGR